MAVEARDDYPSMLTDKVVVETALAGLYRDAILLVSRRGMFSSVSLVDSTIEGQCSSALSRLYVLSIVEA